MIVCSFHEETLVAFREASGGAVLTSRVPRGDCSGDAALPWGRLVGCDLLPVAVLQIPVSAGAP